MSAQHTPGPWKAVADPFHFATLSTVVGGGHAEKGLQRAMIVQVGGYAGWQEQEANARLIAAAPDLLAALEALVEGVDRLLGKPEPYECDDGALAAARAAILKATGGQQ